VRQTDVRHRRGQIINSPEGGDAEDVSVLHADGKRAIVEGRLMNESVMVLGELRRRLESGPPASDATEASP
jgi:hypothetical protein